MLRGIIRKAKKVLKANMGRLLVYFGLYGIIIAAMNYGLSILNIRRATFVLPMFLLSPILVLMMKRCFEFVMGRDIRSSVTVGKIYQMSFVTVLLPLGIKAYFPAVPKISMLVDFVVLLGMLYVMGRFFLSAYIVVLNPRLPVGEVLKLSWQKMSGNLSSLGVMMAILCLPLLIPLGISLLLEKELVTAVLLAVSILLYGPFMMVCMSVFAGRVLGGEDDRTGIKLSELDLKHFFEETVENGPAPAVTQKINLREIEAIEQIPVAQRPEKRKKRPEAVAAAPAPKHHAAESNPYEWTESDRIDPAYFGHKASKEAPVPQAIRFDNAGDVENMTALRQMKNMERTGKTVVEQLSQLNASELFRRVMPYEFLRTNAAVYAGFEDVLRGALKKFQRCATKPRYSAHLSKTEVEGNRFAWLMEIKEEAGHVTVNTELYINHSEW